MKTIRIYQLDDKNQYAIRFLFEPYDRVNGDLTLDLYKVVYECEVEDDTGLDNIYSMFQSPRLEGFRGHSLSISDIVFMDDEYFYCDDYGWKDVTDLFPKPTLKEGEEYECVRDFVMEDGSVAYKAGKTYRVLNDYGHLGIDEAGSNLHKMSDERDFYCYFRKVETKKKYIVTSNGVTYNIWFNTREEAQARADKLNEDYYMRKVWNVEEVIDEDSKTILFSPKDVPQEEVA